MENNELGKIAYNKTEELEERLASLNLRLDNLEAAGVSTPSDPNDTPDEPYTPPAPGTIITTGALNSFPIYYQKTGDLIKSYPFYFTCDETSTLIIKLDINIEINSTPSDLVIDLLLDDTVISTYTVVAPSVGTYKASFAESATSSQIGHKLHFKINAVSNSTVYTMTTADLELSGNNVDILTKTHNFNIFYNDANDYYISKCANGDGNLIITPQDNVNLNETPTETINGIIELGYLKNLKYLDSVWQYNLYAKGYRLGNGYYYLKDYDNVNSALLISTGGPVDYGLKYNNTYPLVAIYANNTTGLSYANIYKDYSSRSTSVLETSSDKFVDINTVKVVNGGINHTFKKLAAFVATRNDGQNTFYSNFENFHKVSLGYGTNVTAVYANEEGKTINIYMRVYNQIVLKVLVYNDTTSQFELTTETSIGSWDKYIEGVSANYFTVTNNELTFNTTE